MWEQITSSIKDFFNQDIVVIISSILTALGSVLIILSKTSIGNKAISWCKEQIDATKKISEQTKETIEQVKILANNSIDRLNAEYDAKSRLVISYFELVERYFVEIVELIPNAKVQAKLSEFKVQFDEEKKQIAEIIGLTYDETMKIVNEKVNEAQSIIAEKEKALDDAIEKANELINQLENYNEEEKEYGEEREEKINSNTAEETI